MKTDNSLSSPDISVIVPVLDEEQTLEQLFQEIVAACVGQGKTFEVLFVDDGSADGSWRAIQELTGKDSRARGFRLRRNFGKAAALSVGFQEARAALFVTMDADLQDDPSEIPNFLAKIGAGADLITGWKTERKDPLGKRLPSALFNLVVRWFTGLPLHDFNCGFKAGHRDVFRSLSLYGELHRFIPVLVHAKGFRVAEIPVRHHPRRHGKSKYGMRRFTRGFLDLLTVTMITQYGGRPGHLFGGIGLTLAATGTAILIYLVGLKMFSGQTIGDRPLLLLGILIEIVAVQLVLFGMLAELIVSRTDTLAAPDMVSERAEPAPNDPAVQKRGEG